MVEINREDFEGMEHGKKEGLLFDNLCGVETALRELKQSVDDLAKSPWRMAIPPISWKAIGAFSVVMALIIKGDVDKAFKLIGLMFGFGG